MKLTARRVRRLRLEVAELRWARETVTALRDVRPYAIEITGEIPRDEQEPA